MSILATFLLLATLTAHAASGPSIVTETHITSYTEQKSCDESCIMAHKLFNGVGTFFTAIG
jgi:hypothetical protein